MSNENNASDINDKIFSVDDYYALYQKERERNRSLEQELAFHRVEIDKFKNEAAKAYLYSKERDKESTLMTAQADMILHDLHTVNKNLRQKIKELDKAKNSIHEAYKDTINRLVLASEYKDNETGNHILRMSNYCAELAKLYGFDTALVEEIELASPMHDVGKIGIRDSIVFKNGKLTNEEFDDMKKHTLIGADILKNPASSILECARLIALNHHEKWNGRGYPNGVKGEKIPIQARMASISDTFDALTSKRPYKAPYPIDVSCDIIKKGRGEDFDPELVDIFLANIENFVVIKNRIDANGLDEETVRENFTWSERDIADGRSNS